MFFIFFFVGEAFLNLFNVDISSFAVAGSFIIFIVALEMILDIEIFKDTPDAPKDATFVPVVFPLIAGAGALTTLLSIRAQYNDINILLAVICNMVIVYLVLNQAHREDAGSRIYLYAAKVFRYHSAGDFSQTVYHQHHLSG